MGVEFSREEIGDDEYWLRDSAGVVREHLKQLFGSRLSVKERNAFLYYAFSDAYLLLDDPEFSGLTILPTEGTETKERDGKALDLCVENRDRLVDEVGVLDQDSQEKFRQYTDTVFLDPEVGMRPDKMSSKYKVLVESLGALEKFRLSMRQLSKVHSQCMQAFSPARDREAAKLMLDHAKTNGRGLMIRGTAHRWHLKREFLNECEQRVQAKREESFGGELVDE